MNCQEARHHMLEAEPEALQGCGTDPLAQHVQHCAECRGHARTILARTDDLRASLDAIVALHTEDWAADRARRVTSGSKVAGSRTRRLPRLLLPLALAAGITALVLRDDGLLRLPFVDRAGDEPALHIPQRRVPESPIVNAVGARGVAVMQTANPKITVVWTF